MNGDSRKILTELPLFNFGESKSVDILLAKARIHATLTEFKQYRFLRLKLKKTAAEILLKPGGNGELSTPKLFSGAQVP